MLRVAFGDAKVGRERTAQRTMHGEEDARSWRCEKRSVAVLKIRSSNACVIAVVDGHTVITKSVIMTYMLYIGVISITQ